MKKVLLISSTPVYDTPYSRKTRVYPPTGIYRLKFWAEKHTDAKVDIVNSQVLDPADFLEKHAEEYDIIGVQCLDYTLENDMGNIILAGYYNPTAVLVAGCYGAAYNDTLLRKYTPVDHIIYGEGETQLVDVIRGRDPVPRELTESEWREAVMLTDFKAMGLKEAYNETKKRFGTDRDIDVQARLFTSSTCTNNCFFCSEHEFIHTLKFLTPAQIKLQVERAVEAGATFIIFHDDNSLIGRGKDNFHSLYDSGYKFPVPFMMQTSVRSTDYDTLCMLKSLGMVNYTMGVESLSPVILRDFNKPQRVGEIEKVMSDTLKVGMNLYANVILSSPHCTTEDIKVSLRGIKVWMDRGIKFGINPYPLAFSGSRYADMEIGYVTHKDTNIPHTDMWFKKRYQILPLDVEARRFILTLEDGIKGLTVKPEVLSEKIVELGLSLNR